MNRSMDLDPFEEGNLPSGSPSVASLLSGETNPLVDRCTRIVLFPGHLRDPSDWAEVIESFDVRYVAPLRALPPEQQLDEVRALVGGLECYVVSAALTGAAVAWDPGFQSRGRKDDLVELVRPLLAECRAWYARLRAG